MPSLVKIPLPTGKIGVSFKGTPPKVQNLVNDSPMKNRIKEGYIFQSLILNDGTVVENLTTSQLIEALKDSSEEEGRKIVMEIALPDSAEVALPEGAIGVSVQNVNGKPTITQVGADSPLKSSLRVGYVVEKVTLEDGTELSGHSAEEIERILSLDAESSGRRLSLVNPAKFAASNRKVTLPMEKLLTLPTGKLGLKFKGDPATISGINDDSPLKGIAREEFVIDSLIFPDGAEYIGCRASELCKVLANTSDVEGRIMLLKSPENPALPTSATVKVVLPKFGNASELGLTVGAGGAIKAIEGSSSLVGHLAPGNVVIMVHDGSSTEYQITDEETVEDAILDSSGCAGRYLIVKP